MKQGITTKTKRMKIMSMKNLIVIITKVIMRMTMMMYTWRLVKLAKVSFSMERSRLLCRCSSTSLLRLANSDPCSSDDDQHDLHWWSAWSALLWSLLCRCSSTTTLRLANFSSTVSNTNLNYCQLILRLLMANMIQDLLLPVSWLCSRWRRRSSVKPERGCRV